LRHRLQAEIGASREVLIESEGQGRTEHYLPVAIADGRVGSVVPLMITGSDGERLTT
jgi:threonylcarbamoyladenosine tRNA methylthiotransferase MtaB